MIVSASGRARREPSRRELEVFLAATVSGALACQSPGRARPAPPREGRGAGGPAGAAGARLASAAGEGVAGAPLDVQEIGRMRPGERGGRALVLLHGWGAPGDDLVPLAEALARPGVRIFVPAAPLPEMGGGRAWWHLDFSRPAHSGGADGDLPAQPHRQVAAARAAVQALLRRIQAEHAPDELLLAGFSQGGMLTLDVALAADPPVTRAAALSGALLAESADRAATGAAPRTSFFLSHGRHDEVLRFAGAERAKERLERGGHPVTFVPFEGGHEIPSVVVRALAAFLFDAGAGAR
jgi:phospholipase/carboxylesterase